MAETLASPSLAATLENAGVTDSRPRTLTILVSESDSFKVSIADYLSRTLSGGALTGLLTLALEEGVEQRIALTATTRPKIVHSRPSMG